MTTRTVKLYPSTQHHQLTDQAEVPVSQAIAYLQTLVNAVPADERNSVRIRGWGGVQVWYDHKLSEAEQFAETLARVRGIIQAAGGRGLTAEQVDEIVKIIGR